MPTRSLDTLADTILHEKAVAFADRCFDECRGEVSPTQISGLRQVATQEPLRVAEFAKQQARRYEGQRKDPAQVAFWKGVLRALGEEGNEDWSIKKFVEELARQEFALQGIDPSKKELRAAADDWRRLTIPPFIRSFCVHYLYRKELHARS